LTIRPIVEADLRQARAWYDQQAPGLGAEFLLDVEETLEGISRNSLAYPLVYRDIRRALTRRFPYSVYYRLKEGHAVVIGVLHSKRSPQVWQRRR